MPDDEKGVCVTMTQNQNTAAKTGKKPITLKEYLFKGLKSKSLSKDIAIYVMCNDNLLSCMALHDLYDSGVEYLHYEMIGRKPTEHGDLEITIKPPTK